MGITKICIEGLNDIELDLVEIKLREIIQQIKKCSEIEKVKVWTEIVIEEGSNDVESV